MTLREALMVVVGGTAAGIGAALLLSGMVWQTIRR